MRNGRDQTLRQQLAETAARIMDEQGVRDFALAKRKAAEQIGARDQRLLPSNREVEEALVTYQRLFKSQSQPQHLRTLRESALKAMQLLAGFEPRLAGSVLTGTAGAHSDINLHLFSDTAEQVALFLMERGIPYQSDEHRFRLANGEHASYPAFRFDAGGVTLDLTVFPPDGLREAPRSPVDGRPMRRASLRAVEALLSDTG
jgi:hypothetical protein